jgi:ParB family chromosome partitioning protein
MPEFMVVPVSSISAPAMPLRLAMERGSLEELTRSIRHVGLLQPLVVVRRDHGFEVKAGHRRLLACRMAPLDAVPIYVLEGDVEFEASVMLAENIIRTDLTPMEEAHALRSMRETLGHSVAECARLTSKSEQWVRLRLDLLTWPLAAVAALGRGESTVAALRPLMDITDEAERDRLIRCAVEGGATEAVTRSWAASMRGEIADGVDGEGARSRASMQLVDLVVSMPCFACEQRLPSMDLRILRVCDPCCESFERVRHETAVAANGGAASA